MADTISSQNRFYIGLTDEASAETSDATAKTTLMYIQNPKSNLTEAQVKAAMNAALSNGVFLDKYDNPYPSDTAIATGYYQSVQSTAFDNIGAS